jgi:hypothetical protein
VFIIMFPFGQPLESRPHTSLFAIFETVPPVLVACTMTHEKAFI